MITSMEQPRMRRAEDLFDLSAFHPAELLNQVCVLEAVDVAVGSGECSQGIMSRACESFLYAAERVRTEVLKERLLFRTTEDQALVYNDSNVSLKGEPDEEAERSGQSVHRVIASIPEINALVGDYLVHRPEHPSRPLVLHRTLTPEAVCLDGEDERLELIGGSIPTERERSGEEEQEE